MHSSRDLVEVAVGKVLAGEIPADALNVASLTDPYNVMVKILQDGGNETDVADKVGDYPIKLCIEAASQVNGLPIDYPALLDKAIKRDDMADSLLRVVKRLEKGEDADVPKLLSLIRQMGKGEQTFVRLSDVEPALEAWTKAYYHPLDHFIGGIPASSMSVIGGPPGTGKTSLLCKVLINMAKEGKKVAFFSLEMTLAQVMMRMMQLDKRLTKKARRNIYGANGAYTVDEIYAHASRLASQHDDLYCIGVDFADRIRPGHNRDGVAKIDHIYNTLTDLAISLDIPIVVLSQLNDKYIGGRPRVNHLRGSRLIEALGALVLLLYNPSTIDVDQGEDPQLKWSEDTAYLIAGKSRYGFHEGRGVGAIKVDWSGATGWGDQGRMWVNL